MFKRILLGLLLIVVLALAWFHILGSGALGGPWQPQTVSTGPRPAVEPTVESTVEPEVAADAQILFGDLHTHTSLSLDAYLFGSGLIKAGGVVTPQDACDFARYCSALDFWSINDHAESLTPRVWADTVSMIQNCNAQAGDPAHPDMVSFLGWEWSNNAKDNAPSHYGHKNVIFRLWDEGQIPARPIAAKAPGTSKGLEAMPAVFTGVLSLFDSVSGIADYAYYVNESVSTPICPEGVSSTELSPDCREIALTPSTLFKKLDDWGFDSLVIPHGLAWGTTNPLTGDFRTQMDQHEQRYQRLLEVYSGHGNSELFEDFQRSAVDANGVAYCPEGTDNFTPCCQRAGELARARCEDPASAACDEQVAATVEAFLAKGYPGGRNVLEDTTVEDWAACGQLRNTFQPSSAYVPRLSAQYNLALGFDEQGEPKRLKLGLIGSTDNHVARPGNSYKETNRMIFTDSKETGGETVGMSFTMTDKESGGFYYTGGLVAVHAQGRDRDAIWNALNNRNTYATSGGRMLVWFELLNGPSGVTPMGSEVFMQDTPQFKVRALGEFEQLPGCPDYAVAALGEARIESLCGGECYRPGGERRRAIERIEIVRIRPQVRPDEKIAPLVEDNWRVFECPADGSGCEVEFSDPDFLNGGRNALYYARVIQEAEPLISGDPIGCEYDAEGVCIKQNYCIGDKAKPDVNCLSEAEPRAWTSPIFLEFAGAASPQ